MRFKDIGSANRNRLREPVTPAPPDGINCQSRTMVSTRTAASVAMYAHAAARAEGTIATAHTPVRSLRAGATTESDTTGLAAFPRARRAARATSVVAVNGTEIPRGTSTGPNADLWNTPATTTLPAASAAPAM